MKDYIKTNGEDDGIDFDAHYTVDGYRGIAFYLLGWQAINAPVMCYVEDDEGNEIETESGEYELEPDHDNVIAVMVGDDRHHVVPRDDLHVLGEDKFCRSCGQVGCGCNVYV